MTYVTRDGTVCNSPPWNLDRVSKLLYGFIGFVVFFFKSLVGMETNKPSQSGNRSGGWSFFGGSGGGGGGGGGGSPFGPGGGGGGPSKRFRTMKDINPPTVSGGGCPGGSCGM